MNVTQMITAAFLSATSRYPELRQKWVGISWRIGSLLPDSLLVSSVQRAGELDTVLRCMEDDLSARQEGSMHTEMFSLQYQSMLSELWVGAVYEIPRLLNDRKLAPESDTFRALAHDFRLLRISIDKHEIAAQGKLSGPLSMQRYPAKHDDADDYVYSKGDPQRAHIMPSGVSSRGSVMWQVIDIEAKGSYWLERRTLSERFIELWTAE